MHSGNIERHTLTFFLLGGPIQIQLFKKICSSIRAIFSSEKEVLLVEYYFKLHVKEMIHPHKVILYSIVNTYK